ncbi:MAG: hypothetical protein RL172_1429 [Bacteroidota bacterium]
MKKRIVLSVLFVTYFFCTQAQLLVTAANQLAYPLGGAPILVDSNDYTLVQKAALFFAADLQSVTSKPSSIIHSPLQGKPVVIIIGSAEKSYYIQQLQQQKKIKKTIPSQQWEGYTIQTVSHPFKGVAKALVITGNDRRGTAFATFEVSRQMGVSPWYWWADVPVAKQQNIYINSNATITDAPKVKYRGIFINDEAPCLSSWSKEKFGGFNHLFYEKVFELMLRLKANYLWPAMWGNAFYDDDSLNAITADAYGIVIGTSHHEPLMRAHDEWRRYGKGRWNYDSNEVRLKEFWRAGIQRATNEKIVSVGMRRDGDEPMSQQTATTLLERIVTDQRQLIEQVTGRPASETPQLWALYKEVQDYYDKGMQVPDDVTLLLCDDNWGNLRKLPHPTSPARKGGYGIYYHFDYVGGPRNYKWINTNAIPRVWEQMHLAYEHRVKQIWIVNVGDIKPMEYPISFFLDYAWNPEKIGPANLQQYAQQWSAAQFGKQYAKDIAAIITQYSKYNSRRKPELLDEATYSLDNFNEWQNVVTQYNLLLQKATQINNRMLPAYKNAFYQLVLHPVHACANLNELYLYTALNKQAYAKKSIHTNTYAAKVQTLFTNDSLLTVAYHQLNNGKWNHLMSQQHIGYTSWQQPKAQTIPTLKWLPQNMALKATKTPILKQKTTAINTTTKGSFFYEKKGYGIAIEAAHFTKAINSATITWTLLPDHGRTGDAITSFPVTAPQQTLSPTSPHLQYDIYTYSKDSVTISTYCSPSLNFYNTPNGLQYAISIDDEIPQLISINKEDKNSISGIWNKWVSDNIIIKTSIHTIPTPGKHTVKYWMVNSGVVLQKLVLNFGTTKQSYLGPPETITIK